MGLNDTPSSVRVQIGLFGRTNAGKSSLMNALTGQDLAVVSEVKGTTTDPVYKSMELLPIGPVVIIDTPGFDDSGYLGEMRIKKAGQVLRKTDIAVLVVSSEEGLSDEDRTIKSLLESKKIPYITVYSKSDLTGTPIPELNPANEIQVSSSSGHNITELKNMIAALADRDKNE